jgi:hypothetical protein
VGDGANCEERINLHPIVSLGNFTSHGKNKGIPHYFFEKGAVILQCTVCGARHTPSRHQRFSLYAPHFIYTLLRLRLIFRPYLPSTHSFLLRLDSPQFPILHPAILFFSSSLPLRSASWGRQPSTRNSVCNHHPVSQPPDRDYCSQLRRGNAQGVANPLSTPPWNNQ